MANTIRTDGPDAMVILKAAANQFCGKHYDGQSLGARAKIKSWIPNVAQIEDIKKLYKVMKQMNATKSYCIIRGKLKNKEFPRGKKVERRYKTPDAPFTEEPRRWLAVDHDGFPVKSKDLQSQLEELIALYPPEFQGTSYVYQVTSSYGIKKGLYVRLFWLLEEPAEGKKLKAYFSQFPDLKVDTSIYMPVQPHYVTPPAIAKTIKEPFPDKERVGICEGIIERVNITQQLEDIEVREVEYSELVVIGEGNPAQIDHALEQLINQRVDGSRHHTMMGCMMELISLGTPAARVIKFGHDFLAHNNRAPNAEREVEDAYEACLEKINTGSAQVNVSRLDDVFPEYEEDELLEKGESHDMDDMLGYVPKINMSYQNAEVFLARNYPEKGLLRWNQETWKWRNGCWTKMETEQLGAEIAAETHFAPSIVSAIERAALQQRYAHDLKTNRFIDRPHYDPGTILVFKNGMVHLDDLIQDPKMALAEHDPNYFNTNSLDFKYDPEATCETWEQFLYDCFAEDESQQREFKKMFGYLLSGQKQYHKFFIFQGQPRCGKGTTFDVLRDLMGEKNTASLPLSNLQGDFALQPLVGKSLWLLDEVNEQNSRALEGRVTDLIKTQTGGGALQVERKFKDSLTDIKLDGRLVMACNRLPGFMDPSGALSARMVLFRFVNSFVGRENFKLGQILKTELSGIFNWALRGYLDLMEDGAFKHPESIRDFVIAHQEAMAPVQAFANNCLIEAPGEQVYSKELYDVYRVWARESGRREMSIHKLGMELQQLNLGYTTEKKRREKGANPERAYVGLAFTDEAQQYRSAMFD